MDSDAWDPTAAFKPGSGRFGWMVNPVAVLITGNDMNQREKVLEAIDRVKNNEQNVIEAASNLRTMEGLASDARANLIRTLHAVYGDRAASGVVVGGKLYRVREGQLVVERVEFEVLA